MPCWIAFPIPDPAQAAIWADAALAFTPRVTLEVPGVVLMEVKASRRLFGGEEALLRHVQDTLQAQQVRQSRQAAVASLAEGPDAPGHHVFVAGRGQTAHAALACLQGAPRAGGWCGHWQGPTTPWLDPLPCIALKGWEAQGRWLSTLGVRTIGELRALPRPGLARRLGPELLRVLDQALGVVPEVWHWEAPAERFELWREFDGRQEQAAALLHEAQAMLDALVDWLMQRQSGVASFSVHWRLDHARGEPAEDGLVLNLAQPSRDRQRLGRLLQERLGSVTLNRPALGLTLRSGRVEKLPDLAGSLFVHPDAPDGAQWQEPEVLRTAAGQREQALRCEVLVEQLSARLGARQVLQGELRADHRPEKAQQWWPAAGALRPRPAKPALGPDHDALPLPTWLLDPPKALPWQPTVQGLQPAWQGALRPMSGPHRIATAWWDTQSGGTLRDYQLMHSPGAGLVWVCRDRPGTGSGTNHCTGTGPQAWHLHGLFA